MLLSSGKAQLPHLTHNQSILQLNWVCSIDRVQQCPFIKDKAWHGLELSYLCDADRAWGKSWSSVIVRVKKRGLSAVYLNAGNDWHKETLPLKRVLSLDNFQDLQRCSGTSEAKAFLHRPSSYWNEMDLFLLSFGFFCENKLCDCRGDPLAATAAECYWLTCLGFLWPCTEETNLHLCNEGAYAACFVSHARSCFEALIGILPS